MSVDNRLLKETNPEVGQPTPYVLPQHGIDGTQQFGRTMGRNGHMFVASKDGEITTIGATTDAESASGNGTFIAILKRVRTLLTAVFEAVVTLGQAIGTAKAILIAGSDGTNLRAIRTKSDGTTLVEVTGSTVAEAQAIPTRQVTRKLAVVSGLVTQSVNIGPSGQASITIAPPVGELWRIKLLYFVCPPPAGSTTGIQVFYVMTGGDNPELAAIGNVYAFNAGVQVQYGTGRSATTLNPALAADQQRAILNLVATNSCPLVFRLENLTNGTISNTAIIRLVREVEYIA